MVADSGTATDVNSEESAHVEASMRKVALTALAGTSGSYTFLWNVRLWFYR
jgi:hypothetical protein